MAEMFSDIERSPTWQSPSMIPAATPGSQASNEFQPPQHPQHHYGPSQQAPGAYHNSTPSSARPPVQPGWFPLQDVGGSDQQIPRGQDMYSGDSMMPPQPHRQPVHWTTGDSSPYMSHDTRQMGPPRHPDTAGFSSPMYSQGYHTPVPDMNGSQGFGWQDARPMPPPPIHTTGLEHLRNMNMPGAYEDMHRVHQAAQGMHAMMGMGPPQPRYPGMHGYGSPPRKKNQREISVGRWTADEHRVFLKGLEMYQGPAWGEIARMIGTRTSTQVRTHAQKFFTKLARTNQMLPYFESQIQKERTRLISQGAVTTSQSSVTPTGTNAHNFTFSTLSPPRKREYIGPRIPGIGYDEPHNHTQRPMSSAPGYLPNEQISPLDMYKSRLDGNSPEIAGIRKPRLSSLEYPGLSAESPYGDPQTPMAGYNSADAYRDPSTYQNPVNPAHNEWSDLGNRQWTSMSSQSGAELDPSHSNDPDSLPSVTRLLYRGPMTA